MQPTQFIDAVQSVLSRDSRYDIGAYYFLKDALDFTVKRVMEHNDGEQRHVAASELLFGFRDYAILEYGPMASTLMREWGLSSCADIGEMVFMLIDEGVFGKQDSDTPEDFAELFPLIESLDAPFLPSSPVPKMKQAAV
ncbi:MAG: Minf_1886 family protein [Akkermansiaceae bacterium]